jgi:hypothetical protein
MELVQLEQHIAPPRRHDTRCGTRKAAVQVLRSRRRDHSDGYRAATFYGLMGKQTATSSQSAYDLRERNGKDLRELPLVEREKPIRSGANLL